MNIPTLLDSLFADLRSALRSLARSPGITFAAIAALALGVGANTAIFSVVDGILLHPLPYPQPEQLFTVNTGWGDDKSYKNEVSFPQYQDLVAQTRAFQSVGAWFDSDANLSGGASVQRVLVRGALPSLLPTLRVQPVLGRNFLDEETTAGRGRVALISHELWASQFGGAPGVIDKSVRLDGVDHRIVGVLPAGFELEQAVDVWVPLDTSEPGLKVRNSHFLSVVARRRAEATPEMVAEDLASISKYQVDHYPETYPAGSGFGLHGRPYLDSLLGEVRRGLYVLLGAVGFVLLIACANVANLLLARGAARESEMAIRIANGAGRGRLIRQLLTESLVLSLLGGGVGVLCAFWGLDALMALGPKALPRAGEVAVNLRVLLFTGAVSVLTGVVFGMAPALATSRPNLHDALKDGARGSSGGGNRLRKALVTVEVALSLVLLVGAGLMLRSFVMLRQVDPGFRPDHAWTLRIARTLPDRQLTTVDRDNLLDFYSRTLARLAQLPGVTAAGAGTIVPLDGDMRNRLIDIEGEVVRDTGKQPSAQYRLAMPGWFKALGIPLLRGRDIADSDDPQAPVAVVVNEAFVRQWFPDGDALGHRIRLGKLTREFPWGTIVGIVGDVRSRGLDAPADGEMFWPIAQAGIVTRVAIVVRTAGDPAQLAAPVRAAIAEIDPAQPVFDEQTLETLAAASIGQRRFTLTLMMIFGLIALALASVGIYGVMAYVVVQRTREIGIRVALGAQRAGVLRMVLWDGMKLVLLGIGAGTACALVVTRVLSSLLFGVSTVDAVTYLAVGAALAAAGLVAMAAPTARALRVDPIRALRGE